MYARLYLAMGIVDFGFVEMDGNWILQAGKSVYHNARYYAPETIVVV